MTTMMMMMIHAFNWVITVGRFSVKVQSLPPFVARFFLVFVLITALEWYLNGAIYILRREREREREREIDRGVRGVFSDSSSALFVLLSSSAAFSTPSRIQYDSNRVFSQYLPPSSSSDIASGSDRHWVTRDFRPIRARQVTLGYPSVSIHPPWLKDSPLEVKNQPRHRHLDHYGAIRLR